jgi:predicted transposase/invertase (TIGR01784 family)
MPRTPITHPHDFLVKATFGRKEVMQDFLESRLPQETLQRIAMESLQLTNKSFTPRTGKNKHSDLIYAATMDGQAGYLYLHLEHQAKEEKYMPLRQLEAYYPVDLRSDNVAKIKKDKKETLAELALQQGGISKDFCDWLDMHEALLSEPYCISLQRTR